MVARRSNGVSYPDYTCEVLAWVDLESTGLDPYEDSILEFAMVLTDPDLAILAEPTNVVCIPKPGWEDRMVEVVREMHEGNGLLDAQYRDAAEETRWLVSALQGVLCAQFEALGFHKGHVWLAGSGVSHFDRLVIDAQMPRVSEWFPYFNFDTGNLRRAATLWAKELLLPGHSMDDKPHRALPDLLLHIDEAKHFRELFQLVQKHERWGMPDDGADWNTVKGGSS
jgi:oligoribonuclease